MASNTSSYTDTVAACLRKLQARMSIEGKEQKDRLLMRFETEYSLACNTGIWLKWRWLYATENKPRYKREWWTHVKFCEFCRDEFAACDRLAQLAYTAEQEQAWEAMDE